MEQLNKKNSHFYFQLLAVSIAVSLVLPYVFTYGMFMDGIIYCAISFQQAQGLGDLWHLHLSDTFFSIFHEHPPLAMFLHGLLFKLSDSFMVDKLYSFAMYLLNILGIVLVWKQFFIDNKQKQNLWWVALVFYISIPLVSWAFKNNMLENTMSFFCLFSVYFMLKAIQLNKWYFQILAALFLVLAFLSKGFTGLFPLTFPFIYFLFNKNTFPIKQLIIHYIVLIGFILFFSSFIYFNEEANFYISKYLNGQVLGSLEGARGNDGNRFFIITKLLSEFIPAFILVALFLTISYFKNKNTVATKNIEKKYSLFLLIALSASLPILLSPRQSGYYAFCSFPFFAITFALLVIDTIEQIINKVNSKTIQFLKIGIALSFTFCVIFSIYQFKKFERDEIILTDIFKIAQFVSKKEIISAPVELNQSWTLFAYFSRYANISINTQNQNLQYYIIDTEHNSKIPENYNEITLNLKRFKLYSKN